MRCLHCRRSWESCCSSELLSASDTPVHWPPSSSLSYTVCLKQPSLPFLDKFVQFLQAFFTAPNPFAQVSASPMSLTCLAHRRSFIDAVLGWFVFYLFIFGRAGA